MRRIGLLVLSIALVLATPTSALAKTYKVGKPAKLGDYKITIYLVERPAPVGVFAPDAGNDIVAVDVAACNRTESTDLTINALQFTLETDTHHRYDAFGATAHEPTLSVQPLPGKGSCARGWVAYEVPTTEIVRSIYFQTTPLIGDTYRFKVPKPA